MKQRLLAGTASALLTAAALGLTGCGGQPASSLPDSSSDVSSIASNPASSNPASSSSPESTSQPEPFVFPDPVTGTYNGQTITMKYVTVTDYIWPMDNLRPYAFSNGYTPFYVYEFDDEGERLIGGTYMDKNGKLLCDPIYKDVYPFNDSGIALAQKSDGGWVYIDTKGTASPTDDYSPGSIGVPNWSGPNISGEVSIVKPNGCSNAIIYNNKVIVADFIEGEYLAKPYGDYSQLFDSTGNLLNDTKFDRIGNFYNGLAPVIFNNKLGIIDDKGSIVIQPTYPSDINLISDMLYLSEDLILMNTQGHISIIEIVRT